MGRCVGCRVRGKEGWVWASVVGVGGRVSGVNGGPTGCFGRQVETDWALTHGESVSHDGLKHVTSSQKDR